MEIIIVCILILILLCIILWPVPNSINKKEKTVRKIEVRSEKTEKVEKTEKIEKAEKVEKVEEIKPRRVHIDDTTVQYLKIRYGILLEGDKEPYTYFEYSYEAYNYARMNLPHKKWTVVTSVDYIEKV